MASTTPRLDFDAWWYLWLSQRQTANKPAAIDAARAGWSAAARTLELEVAALREQVARLMKAPEDTLREQLAAARREMRERCAATAGKKSSWTYDPHGEDADYWNGYSYGRRDAENEILAARDALEGKKP